MEATIDVTPAGPSDWDDVESVFMTVASARNCWCQFHVLENSTARMTNRQSRRKLLVEQISTLEPGRGLLARSEDGPVGWCGVEPRNRLRHVLASKLVRSTSPYPREDPGVWAVYCLLVPPEKRRLGIGSQLLSAAVDHARRAGGWAMEGYPIDTAQRGGELPPGFSTGTLDMFEDAGFEPVESLPSGRTLVHRPI